MARVHRVAKSAKEHTCGNGHVIPKGDPYTWAKPGFRTRKPLIRCERHPFRPSDLTTSMASEPMAAQEAFMDAAEALDPEDEGALDELESLWQDLADAVNEYADAREQALDTWENGNSQLQDLFDTADRARDDVASFEVDASFEPNEDETAEEQAEARTEHARSQIDEATGIASGLEF